MELKYILKILGLILLLIHIGYSNDNYNLENLTIQLENTYINNQTLNFNISIDKLNYDDYNFIFGFYNNKLYTHKSNKYINLNKNNLNFNISTDYFNNSEYNLFFIIENKETNIIYKNNSIFKFEINNSNKLNLTKIDFNQSKIQIYKQINETISNTNLISNEEIVENLDLKLSQLNYLNNSLNITIENIGNKNAINFKLKIFDSNNSNILEKKFTFLGYNQTLNLNYNLTINSSNLTAILYFLNSENIESNFDNNYINWPKKEETKKLKIEVIENKNSIHSSSKTTKSKSKSNNIQKSSFNKIEKILPKNLTKNNSTQFINSSIEKDNKKEQEIISSNQTIIYNIHNLTKIKTKNSKNITKEIIDDSVKTLVPISILTIILVGIVFVVK